MRIDAPQYGDVVCLQPHQTLIVGGEHPRAVRHHDRPVPLRLIAVQQGGKVQHVAADILQRRLVVGHHDPVAVQLPAGRHVDIRPVRGIDPHRIRLLRVLGGVQQHAFLQIRCQYRLQRRLFCVGDDHLARSVQQQYAAQIVIQRHPPQHILIRRPIQILDVPCRLLDLIDQPDQSACLRGHGGHPVRVAQPAGVVHQAEQLPLAGRQILPHRQRDHAAHQQHEQQRRRDVERAPLLPPRLFPVHRHQPSTSRYAAASGRYRPMMASAVPSARISASVSFSACSSPRWSSRSKATPSPTASSGSSRMRTSTP